MKHRQCLCLIIFFTFIIYTWSLPNLNDVSVKLKSSLFEATRDVLAAHSFHQFQDEPTIFNNFNKRITRSVNSTSNSNSTKRYLFQDLVHNFMHSYIPKSGINNREKIEITNVQEIKLVYSSTSKPKAWKYIYFNNTNYIMSHQQYFIYIWSQYFTSEPSSMTFQSQNAFCFLDTSSQGEIYHSIFYKKKINFAYVLYLSVIIKTKLNGFVLKNYHVDHWGCREEYSYRLTNQIPLIFKYFATRETGSLVVLYERSIDYPQIEHIYTSENRLKIIKVFAKGAADLATFQANDIAYLAVAHAHGLDVFQFNEYLNDYLLYQNLYLIGIVDVEIFKIGYQPFMTIVTNTAWQHLLVWKNGLFYPKQVFSISSVIQAASVTLKMCHNEIFLIFYRNNSISPIKVYSWSGSKEQFKLQIDNLAHFISHPYLISPFSQTVFIIQKNIFMLSYDIYNQAHLISFSTDSRSIADPVIIKHIQIRKWIENIKQRIQFQSYSISKLKSQLTYAVRPSSKIIIKANQVVKQLKSSAASFKTFGNLRSARWQGSSLTLKDMSYTLDYLNNLLNNSFNVWLKVHSKLKNAVFKNERHHFYGKVNFIGQLVLPKLQTSKLTLRSVLQKSVHELFYDLVPRNFSKLFIKGSKFFKNDVYFAYINNSLFNGYDLSQQVILNNSVVNHFHSPLKFRTMFVQKSLQSRFGFQNLDLSKLILLEGGRYFIPSLTVFNGQQLFINLLKVKFLNGFNLNQFKSNYLTVNSPQRISHPVYIRQVSTDSLKVNFLVNQLELSHHLSRLVRIDKPANITGPVNLYGLVKIAKSLNFQKLNSFHIPHDFLTTFSPQNVFGHKAFQKITFNQLTVHGSVNNLHLPYDVVTLSRNETIYSPVHFETGFNLLNSMKVTQLVDGVNLTQLQTFFNKIDDKLLVNRVAVRGSIQILKNLYLHGYINDLNISHLYHDAIFKNSPFPIYISGPKYFTQHLQMTNLKVKRVNGISLLSLVKTSGFDLITSPIVINSPVYIKKIISNSGKIGEINLENLIKNRISLTEQGFIAGPKSFESIEIGLHLKLNGRINNLSPSSDLVFKSRPQTISGFKIFYNNLITTGSLELDQSEVYHQINWMKTHDLFKYRIPLNVNEYLPINAIIYNCTIPSIRLIYGKNFNNYNLQLALSQVLYRHSNQNITAPKRFLSPVTVLGPITGSVPINGISMKWLKSNVIRTDGSQIITLPLTFLNSLEIIGSLTVYKLINYQSLHKLAFESLRRTYVTQLRGPQVFLGGLSILNNLHCGFVNNVNLTTGILKKSTTQSLFGHITISNLIITGDTQLFGYLNGYDLVYLDKLLVQTDRQNYIYNNFVVSKPIEVYGDLKVKGTLNQINLASLKNDIFLPYGDQLVSGTKSVKSVLFKKNINIGMLNGKMFNSVVKEMIFINLPWAQMIRAKTFEDQVDFKNSLVQEYGVAFGHGLINGINITHLYASAVRLHSPSVIHGSIFFENLIISESIHPIMFKGKINGINLIHDVFWLNPVQNYTRKVWGTKIFGPVHFGGDVIVYGKVNNLNLSRISFDTLYKFGSQYISGHKLTRRLIVYTNALVGTLNYKNVSDIMTKNNLNKYAYGNWTFENNAYFDRNLRTSGYINGVNLTQVVQGSLFKDNARVLTQPITFQNVVFNRDVKITGKLNQMSMKSVMRSVRDSDKNFSQINNEIENALKRNLIRSNELLAFMSNPSIMIHGFALLQNLNNVLGNSVEYYKKKDKIALTELNLKNHSSVVHVIQFADNKFKVGRVIYRPIFVERKPFIFGYETFFVFRSSPLSDYQSLIKTEQGVIIKTLGNYIDDIQTLSLGKNIVILACLSKIRGILSISALQKIENRISFVTISSINVGSGAVKSVLFEVNKELYFIVARNFYEVCGVRDSGTLIYYWNRNSRNAIEVVQRITSIEPNDVEHYEFNGQHYLVFTDNQTPSEKLHHFNLHIYRNSPNSRSCQFSLFQSLNFDNVKKFIVFKYGPPQRPLLFLAAVNSTMVQIWKQEGHSGFQDNWSIRTVLAETIGHIVVNHKLFIVVGQMKHCLGSVIYEAITKGVYF